MSQTKKIVWAVVAVVFLGMFAMFSSKLAEDVDAGEIVVIQAPISGELAVYTQSGWAWQGLGKATHYRKSNQFWFVAPEKGKTDTLDHAIPVKWNDGGHARVSGSVRYDLPLGIPAIIKLHTIFGSQDALENQLIKTNMEKAIYMTGPLMTSKESYAEKRNDLIFYIEDQASKGVYKTVQKEVKVIDDLSGEEKTVTKVEIYETSPGNPIRQEKSPILEYGVRLYNISIKDIIYDKSVEDQIRTQQQAIMNVQTAIANAKKAEQDAITIAKQGEASAAKAKWDQEVIKATQVTEAEMRKSVAVLDVQTAELQKRKQILEGEGEAAKKKLVMQANGALEQKLEAWVTAQQYWAEAFSKYQGNVVPQYSTVTGGGSGGYSGNAAMTFMEIMSMKAAKDLNLDLKNK